MAKLLKTQHHVIDMASKKWEIVGVAVFRALKVEKSAFFYVKLAFN